MSGVGEKRSTAAAGEREPPAGRGPRGGTTTVTRSGWVKKNLWLPRELADRLRAEAFRLRVSEAELIRRGLERLL